MLDLLAGSSLWLMLAFGLIFVVDVLVYRAVSRRNIPWWQVFLATVVSAFFRFYLPHGLAFLVNPLILAFLSYQTDSDRFRLKHVFYGFYAWGVSDLILGTLSFIIFPLLLASSSFTMDLQVFPYLIGVLLVYPIYLFIHRYIGVEYLKNQEEWLFEGRLQTLVSCLILGVTCYGLIMDLQYYFTFVIPGDLLYNYLKLVLLLAVSIFFIMISYANRWIKDRSFDELQEEQERHFQSLRESNQHILHLYQDLSRQGVPKPQRLAKDKVGARVSKRHDCLILTEEELPFTGALPDIANIYSQLLRSVIESQYMAARAEAIDFVLEVPDQLSVGTVDVVDLSLVLQDFLTKAFQVARVLPKGLVRLYMLQEGNHQVLVVETMAQEEEDNLQGEDLEAIVAEVAQNNNQLGEVLERYPQARLVTKSDRGLFSQIFEC